MQNNNSSFPFFSWFNSKGEYKAEYTSGQKSLPLRYANGLQADNKMKTIQQLLREAIKSGSTALKEATQKWLEGTYATHEYIDVIKEVGGGNKKDEEQSGADKRNENR